jgi:hypothetical protein
LKAAYVGNSKVKFKDWIDFDPRRRFPRNGLWLTDAEFSDYQAQQEIRGWREWTDGLDPSLIGPDGKLVDQRALGRYERPKGTRTYYHNSTDLVGVHGLGTRDNELGLSPAGQVLETNAVSTGGELCFAASTPSNEPNSAAWPTSGVYRYQIDATVAGADLTFGLLTQGSGAGHFARVASDLSLDLQTIVQDQAAFSLAGLHIASITNPSWTAGSAGDRFEVLVASVRTTGHGNQDLSLQLGEADDFADGPWAAAVSDNANFFGMNF